jgi:hypothetical protein
LVRRGSGERSDLTGSRSASLIALYRLSGALESTWMNPRRMQILKRTVRRRFVSPLWRSFSQSLESPPIGYPDYLSSLVSEACETFMEGRYIPSLLLTSLSVEWVLISELRPSTTVDKRPPGLAKMISRAKERGLPVDKLMDKADAEREPRGWIFVVRRNKIAHGDVHGYPRPQGRIVFKTPRVIHQMDWFGSFVNASDAYDQLTKALHFLITWRRCAASRMRGTRGNTEG